MMSRNTYFFILILILFVIVMLASGTAEGAEAQPSPTRRPIATPTSAPDDTHFQFLPIILKSGNSRPTSAPTEYRPTSAPTETPIWKAEPTSWVRPCPDGYIDVDGKCFRGWYHPSECPPDGYIIFNHEDPPTAACYWPDGEATP